MRVRDTLIADIVIRPKQSTYLGGCGGRDDRC